MYHVGHLEIIRNELAYVEVGRADTANGSRLLIRVPGTGASISLDALALVALTRLRHGDCAPWIRAMAEMGAATGDEA